MKITEIKSDNKNYPSQLLEIVDYPKMLYVLGNISLLNKKTILGIVGSRNCSEYGRNIATSFANELAKQDITIISGLAIGIDTAAHIGSVVQKRKNNCCFRMWIKSYLSRRK